MLYKKYLYLRKEQSGLGNLKREDNGYIKQH